MYAREIAGTAAEEYRDAQWSCRDCELSDYEWRQRGRCTGPFPDGGHVELRVDLDGKSTTHSYPERFTTCPMGLLRADLHPDEVAVAGVVSHAAAAEVDKRWPNVPARLYALLREWREAEVDRQTAQHEARMDDMRERHGAK